jgi:hypothetical protein
MMNSTMTTLTNKHSVRPWSPLADSVIGQIQTVGFGIADSDQVSTAVKGKAISGPTDDCALSAAIELPPVLAPAAESAKFSVKSTVKESRHFMGFGARRNGSRSREDFVCLTSKKALSLRQLHPTTLPHLVGLEAGSVVLKLDRFANEFDEVLTEIEPGGSASFHLRRGNDTEISRIAAP